MAKPSISKTAVDRRADELDTIASVLPIDRRDELAELLTDQDIETLRHLVNEGMGENTLRALTSDLGVGSGWGRNDTLSVCLRGPKIFAGQQDMRPAQRRDVG